MWQPADYQSENENPLPTQTHLPVQVNNVPPHLQLLSTLDHLLVKQKIELFEVFTGIQTCNKYEIKNKKGDIIFYACEEDDTCARCCCRPSRRPFDIQIWNADKTEIIHLRRELDCSCCGCHQIKSVDKSTVVGKISKQWGGLNREWFTDADLFGISFPLDLDVRIKAVLFGACFLIDFMFYER